jgi:thiol-disulfide isomerase/thioredoxin
VSTSIRPFEFEAFVTKHIKDQPVAVMMHVEWCGACQRTLPQFAAAAVEAKFAALAEIDVTEDREFVDKVGLTGYPGLKVLPKGSPADTPYSEWLSVPYYSRDTEGIVNFLERVDAPDFATPYYENDETELLDNPKFGHLRSLVFSGEIAKLGDLRALKTRFQIVKSEKLCPTQNPGEVCVKIIPARKALVANLKPEQIPMFRSTHKAQIETWIEKHAFPGVWSIEDRRFQWFNDQPVWKVIIAQDPYHEDSDRVNSTVVDHFIACGEKISGKVSLGILNGNSFKDALEEFEIREFPRVLVLGDTKLDYDRYFNDLSLGSLCTDIESLLAGNREIKYRGGIGSKIRHAWKSTMIMLGLESDISKAIALLSSVILITLLAGWCLNSCWPEPVKRKSE